MKKIVQKQVKKNKNNFKFLNFNFLINFKIVKKCASEIKEVKTSEIDFLNNKLNITYENYNDNISDQIAISIENSGYTVQWGNGLNIKYFKIIGMFCEHCVGTVTKTIQNIDGVKNVIVNLDHHIATVIVYPTCNILDIINAVSAVGYEAIPYEGSRDVYLQITGMVNLFINSFCLYYYCNIITFIYNNIKFFQNRNVKKDVVMLYIMH